MMAVHRHLLLENGAHLLLEDGAYLELDRKRRSTWLSRRTADGTPVVNRRGGGSGSHLRKL